MTRCSVVTSEGVVVLDVAVPEEEVGEEHAGCKSGKRQCADECIRKEDYGLLVADLVTALGVVYEHPVPVRQLISVYVVSHIRVPVLAKLSTCPECLSVDLSKPLFEHRLVPTECLSAYFGHHYSRVKVETHYTCCE